jgi:hypothetical protein
MDGLTSTTSADAVADPQRLDEFLSRVVNDLSASLAGVLVSIGHRLGLYKAMAGAGPISTGWLAASTGCAERYVREWLNAQAAGGYVTYDQDSDTYELRPNRRWSWPTRTAPPSCRTSGRYRPPCGSTRTS